MSKFCYNCMKPFGDEPVCPECGLSPDFVQNSPMLKPDTVLASRYRIGRCLRMDGDSYTYAALDMSTACVVRVTEFLVHNLMGRAPDGLSVMLRPDKTDLTAELREDFVDMAHKLEKLSASGTAVKVCDIFEENDTVYFVSIYEDCMPLVDVIDAFRKSGNATWERMHPIFDMLISEFEMLHLSALVHRGVDASTVLLGTDGSIRLSGFSIGPARIHGKGIQINISNDFAAPEQFAGVPYPDRTCDIYSVCALMYRCLTGRVYSRSAAATAASIFPEDVPLYAVNAILRGLSVDQEQRFPTMMELRAALSGEKPVVVPPTEKDDKDSDILRSSEPKPTRGLFIFSIFLAALVLLAGIGAAGLYFIFDINIFLSETWKPASSMTHSYASLPESSVEQEVAKVPHLVGLKLTDVTELYGESEKFTIVTVLSDFNDTYPRDYVMTQTPDAGTPSPGLTTITITVSRGPQYLVMPAVLGKSLDEVNQSLTKLGFDVYLVEVDESYADKLVGTGLTFAKGIVLGCPNVAGSIVKAESTILLFGSVERNPAGTVSAVAQPDGTYVGHLTPEQQVVSSGVVSVVPMPDGTTGYYVTYDPYEVSYTTSYTYGMFGMIVSREQVFASVPENGTVSESYDYFSGATKRIFTPNPERLEGSVTEVTLSDGTVKYILQPEVIVIPGTVSEVINADGTTSSVFIPQPHDGDQIPTVTVDEIVDPITSEVSYVINSSTPASAETPPAENGGM